jgi:ribonuclease HI
MAAELQAIKVALQYSDPALPLFIVSDSQSAITVLTGEQRTQPQKIKNKELLSQIQNLIALRESPPHFVHIFSHHQEKLQADKDKWKPKIAQQKAQWQDHNIPLQYHAAVQLNEEADDLADQATNITLLNSMQRTKHFPNTNVALEAGVHWIEGAFRPWIKLQQQQQSPKPSDQMVFPPSKLLLKPKRNNELKIFLKVAHKRLPLRNMVYKKTKGNHMRYQDPDCMYCRCVHRQQVKETRNHLFSDCPCHDELRCKVLTDINNYCQQHHTDLPFNDSWYTWIGILAKQEIPPTMKPTQMHKIQMMLLKAASTIYHQRNQFLKSIQFWQDDP